jgi:cyanate lyase
VLHPYQFNLTEPVFLRNLTLYPLRGSTTDSTEIATINEILSEDKGEFRELDPPDINRIHLQNRTNNPVLMLDGEEIIGSMQNRIAADSILIPARSTSNIPVICAEEGRWGDIGSFRTGNCSYPGIRAILSHRSKGENGLQKKVWKEIERKLTVTKTLSTTSSMHDIYNNLEDEVTRYMEDFDGLNHDTIGFIGVAGRKILGVDMFCDSATYRKFERKLVQGYALDAIEHRKSGQATIDVTAFLGNVQESLRRKKLTAQTRHFSLKSGVFSGQGQFLNDRIVHLSLFPN